MRVLLAALLAVLLNGCSGDSLPKGSTATPAAEDVALRVITVHGAGDLTGEALAELESQVGDVLSEYVVEGFLGSYPRTDFLRGLAAFSPGIADTAAANLDLLTANRFGDASWVRATRLEARLSFLVGDTTAVGVTASVDFAFEASLDGDTESFRLRGRLMLVRGNDGEWSIFGYDVNRKDGARVEALVSS